jgi:hypothetical protein
VIGSEAGIAGIKYACDFNGYYGGNARSPLLAIDAETGGDRAAAGADPQLIWLDRSEKRGFYLIF